ncbi:MAG: WGR domain-containing protein [Phycisphaerae bacterium]|nr:WGR domain-containing protein [Phycisphaerae bacterium]
MISRYFECVNPLKNKNKFYNVRLKKTPTGNFIVCCEHGRRPEGLPTGQAGRRSGTFIEKEKLFSDFNSAINFFDEVVRTRFAHGYSEVRFVPVADIPYNHETDGHYKDRCREIEAGNNSSLFSDGTKLTQKDVDNIRRAGL